MEAIELNEERVKLWVDLLKQFRAEKGLNPEDEHDGLYDWLRERYGIDMERITAAALLSNLVRK